MPDILPTIDNEPAQGIQALLDTVYLWNQDVANDLIEKINELLEELEDLTASGEIKPYSELTAPVRQYLPMYYENGVYVAAQQIDTLTPQPDMSKWILIATKGSTFVAGTGIDITEDVISVEQAVIQGASAGSTAVQPGDLATVATTGDYNDLANRPVLGTAAAADVTDFATAAQGAKADTAVQPADMTSAISTHNTSVDAHANVISPIASSVSEIEAKIPSQASSSNQLADKNFVNSSIATNTANFIGTFNSVAELEAYSGTVTNNDYAYVVRTDATGNTLYDRYKYTDATTPASWEYEYTLNNSSFTADQWAAINSHATEASINQISTNQQNISNIQTTIGSFGDVVTHDANEFATASQGVKADTALQPGDAVPQYPTLPAPTAASLGTIALYTGQTNLNYTNGYFYTVSPVYGPASATIAQTVGDSLIGLTVDVDMFVAEEQPTQSGNTSFVASAQTTVTPLTVGEYVNGEYIEATINPQVFFTKAREVFGDSVVDNGSTVTLGIIDAAWNMAVCIDGDEHRVNEQIAGDWGIVYNQVPTTGGGATAWLNYTIEHGVVWSKNGTTVDLASYGISYSGSPVNGDTLTVTYVAPGITGYIWTEKLVQPRTTITMITED